MTAASRPSAKWNRADGAVFAKLIAFRKTYPRYFFLTGLILIGVAVYPEVEVVSLVKIPNLNPTVRLVSGIMSIPFVFLLLLTIERIPLDNEPTITRHAIIPLLFCVLVFVATLYSTVLTRKPESVPGWYSIVDKSALDSPRFSYLDSQFKDYLDPQVAFGHFQTRFQDIPIELTLDDSDDLPVSFLYIAKGGGRIVFDLADRIPYRVDPRTLNVAIGWITNDGSDRFGMSICLKTSCNFTTTARYAAVFLYPLDETTKSIIARNLGFRRLF